MTQRESIIRQFEEDAGFALPAEYRNYLVSTGGATPDNNGFEMGEGDDAVATEVWFFGLRTGSYRLRSLPEMFMEYRGRIPGHLLPIGDDPGGNLVCISIADGTRGQVFFVGHDYFAYDEEVSMMGVHFLAASVGEFLDRLRKRA